MRKIIVLVFIVCILSGCASSPITIGNYIESHKIDYPELGVKVKKGLGERLVARGTKTTGSTLHVIQPVQFNKQENELSIMNCAFTAKPGTYFKRGVYSKDNRNADCYGPVSLQNTLSDGTLNQTCPGELFSGDICSLNDGSYFLVNAMQRFPLEQDFQYLGKGKITMSDQDNLIKELIYNGRVGNNLKFIYKEFANDAIRPALSQDVQYDINQSGIIDFKKLRLEVLKATNTEIEYILIKNF